MNKDESILYVPKYEALKFGYYRIVPKWDCYGVRPQKISEIVFTILSLLPWYSVNPFNGYLIKKNKWTSDKYFGNYIYNPHEKEDYLIKKELGIE